MGEKGARLTADATARAEQLVEEWQPLGPVTSKKMFGGHGLFHDGSMFGMVDSKADVFLKARGEDSRVFEDAGSTKHGRMPYWSVPPTVADDEALLREWAQHAIDGIDR